MICSSCPRKCNAERTYEHGLGYCKMPIVPTIARAAIHMWEEPCISGEKGSGTIFFSGCSLGCVFCQNNEISHKNHGKPITYQRLADIFKELEVLGVHNINLVNPTHYIYAIEKAVEIYKPSIPMVYNSGGYDTVETIEKAAKFVDIFLMDMKYRSGDRAKKYSKAADYPEVSAKAILKCAEIIKENIFDDSIMKRGLIIRHLLLPQGTNDAIDVIRWVNDNMPWAVLSIMSQYTPCGDLSDYNEITRTVTKREYNKVLDFAAESNLKNIYTQEFSSKGKEYIPSFDLSGV